MKHDYKFGLTLSESIIENYVQRPLAGYHHDVISGLQENVIISETVHDRGEVTIEHSNHYRSIKLRHRELYTAPPSGDKLMTSFSVSKKTSLSRKRCMINEKCIWNIARKPLSAFQNPQLKTVYSAP